MIFFIHPFTILYLLLGLITNSLHGLIFLYLFGFIHEISHVFVARIFKVKTTEIALYPTGFRAKIGDFSHLSSLRQLAILSAGPLSFFFSAAVIVFFYRWGIISVYGKRLCENYNLLILLFNILPVYPLDGGKIFDIFVANFVDELNCRRLRILISMICLLILTHYIRTLGDLMMIVFVASHFILSLLRFKKEYILYLIKRKFEENSYKIKINRKLKIYRYRNNYCVEKDLFLDEKQIIDRLIGNYRSQKTSSRANGEESANTTLPVSKANRRFLSTIKTFRFSKK